MSGMNAQGLVVHPPNYFFVQLREDYLALAKTFTFQPKDPKDPTKPKKSRANVHCMALLLATMEHWNDSKRGKGRSQWIKMSYQQFADNGMYGLFSRCTIQDSLEVLIGEGLFSRRSYRYEDNNQYEYLFNYQIVNARLARLSPRNQEDMAPTGDYQENEEEGLSANEIRGTSNERRGTSNEIRVSANERLHRFNKDTNKDTNKERESPTVTASSNGATPAPAGSLSSSSSSSEKTEGHTAPSDSKNGSTPHFASPGAAALYRSWVETYGKFGDGRFQVEALDWMAQEGGTFEDIQYIRDRLRQEKPSRRVRPETVKDNWDILDERKRKETTASGYDPNTTFSNGLRYFTMPTN